MRARDGAPRVPREVQIDGRTYRLVEDETGHAGDATPAGPPPLPQEEAPPAADLLTARELEVARLVAGGHPNKQVASVLGISEWTVSTHVRRIFLKLGVDSRAAMVAVCFGARARGPGPARARER